MPQNPSTDSELTSDSSILDQDILMQPDQNNTEQFEEQKPNEFFEIMPTHHRHLAAWAIKTKQSKAAVNDLLTILRVNDPLLPKDYRTLCRTPIN